MSRALWLSWLLAAAALAQGSAYRTADPLGVVRFEQTPVVDGDLGEWPPAEGLRLEPIGAAGGDNPAIATALQQFPGIATLAVALRIGFDREYLYLALDWTDPTPAAVGDAAAMHLELDPGTVAHVRAAATADGCTLTVNGVDALGVGGSAKRRATPTGWTQEIAVPWALLAPATGPPTGAVTVVFDAAWNDLPAAMLQQLPGELRRQTTHVTYDYLTSEDKLFTAGYLSQPQWWGRLVFGNGQAKTRTSTLGTGATELPCPRLPGAIVADGDLADWGDAPRLRVVRAPGFIGDRYAADLLVGDDGEAFCVALHWLTGRPPLNSEPAAKQQGFLGGDCLQIRLDTGKGKMNLCGWYDTNAGISALTADGRERQQPDLLAVGATEAFRPVPNGYVQEIRIPWTALGATPVDSWSATFQPWWAGTSGIFTVQTQAQFAAAPPLTVAYTMPRAGMLSLGLFDGDGRLRRWLLRNTFREAGANTQGWDGRDQFGEPLPPGDYVLKGVCHDPLTLDYKMTATNPGTPPWKTVDNRGGWLSDEANPQAAATDGEWVYLACPGSESGEAIVGLGPDGRRRWGTTIADYSRCVSLALDGDRLYALFSGPELTDTNREYTGKNAIGRAHLYCFDKRTGEFAGVSAVKGGGVKVATWPYREDISYLWDLRRDGFRPGVYGGQHRYFTTGMAESTNALGIAALGGRLYVSLNYENRLLVVDPETAATVGEIALPEPVGLTPRDATHLLAVSAGRIVSVDVASGAVAPVVTAGLSAPNSLATDAADNIYVSDWADSFQVKVFTPDGQPLRAVGTPGGRPWLGAFDPDGMLVPRGIAVTAAGRLWVAEDDGSPRRVSVWDAATGAHLHDYIGPAAYEGWGYTVDPDNAEHAFVLGTEFDLDFASRTYMPVATVTRRTSRNAVFADDGGGMGTGGRILRHDGREYWVRCSSDLGLVIAQRRNGIFQPVAAVGGISRYVSKTGVDRVHWDSELRYHYLPFFPEFFAGHAGDNYSWADTNDDGEVQPAEMRWVKALPRGEPLAPDRQPEWLVQWGWALGPDWSVYVQGFCRDHTVVYRLDPTGWSADGIPSYDAAAAIPIITLPGGYPKNAISSLYVNRNNRLFVTFTHSRDRGNNAERALAAYDRDGKLLWEIAGPKSRSRQELYGDTCADFDIPGIGNVLMTWVWWHNGHAYLYTEDGLYVAALLEQTRIGPTAILGEVSTYGFQTPDGKVYLVNGAMAGHHILEVQGLAGASRFAMPLPLTAAEVARAASRRNATATATSRPILYAPWRPTPPTIDGDLADWQMTAGVALVAPERPDRRATVALARDAQCLYLAYDVRDDTPMVNNGGNWQTPFLSGDCCDLDLALDPHADPNRAGPTPGDLRLLFTELAGEPLAVRYRPRVPGSTGAITLMAARIDEIQRLPGARFRIARADGGYVLEAAVPLADLGIGTATELVGDVGVIYGDATGRDREQRLYYHNANTAMVSDLTTEATLTPRHWGPFRLALAPNLLANGGFEQSLGDTETGNWVVRQAQNGAVARLSVGAGRAGRTALLIEQAKPVIVPDTAWDQPDYEDFRAAVPSGFVYVGQDVPVTAGKQYSLRLDYNARGLKREQKAPGPNRGFADFRVTIFWLGQDIPVPRQTEGAVFTKEDTDGWATVLNPVRRGADVEGTPFTAPPGADRAHIRIQMVCNAEARPRILVDNVELVEVTP